MSKPNGSKNRVIPITVLERGNSQTGGLGIQVEKSEMGQA
jgi:hypothetical protein